MVVSGGVRKEGLKAVVVLMKDRVELVSVTPSTAISHRHECRADGVGDVVEDFLTALHQVACVAFVGVVPEERRGDPGLRIVGIDFVTSDLLPDKPVIRFVAIEAVNYV